MSASATPSCDARKSIYDAVALVRWEGMPQADVDAKMRELREMYSDRLGWEFVDQFGVKEEDENMEEEDYIYFRVKNGIVVEYCWG